MCVYASHPRHGLQVAEAGDSCPICQEGMKSPVKLSCDHLFCEGCVGEWLHRERTCPMCRAVVCNGGAAVHGDGATALTCCLF